MSNATQLKEEGNKLFLGKKYEEALAKYSEAIVEDDSNAVLYANRAACALNLLRYGDAENDAKKSTELNPSYSKAWGRLATAQQALGSTSESILSWKQALDSIPRECPSSGDMRLKAEYEARLKNAQEEHENGSERLIYIRGGVDEKAMPWHISEAMLPTLREAGTAMVSSSAWVIGLAYEEWNTGIMAMKKMKVTETPQGTMMFGPRCEALEGLSNAILRDDRVFHMEGADFIPMYNRQVKFECNTANAWHKPDAETVIREAQKRQLTNGWDDVRTALSITIRAWLLHGFMITGLDGDIFEGERYIAQAVDVLQWGRRAWKDVSPNLRGTVFSDTFVRGVRCMHLQKYMEAYAKNPGMSNTAYPLEDLLEEANDILRDLSPPDPSIPYDPGFISSFYVYPRGYLMSIKGLYYRHLAEYGSGTDIDAIIENFKKSGELYLEAALTFPEDDEQHVWFLNAALSSLFKAGAPLRLTLPILARIRVATPKMQAIWKNSQLAQSGRDQTLQKLATWEEEVRKALAEGEFGEDAQIVPEVLRDD